MPEVTSINENMVFILEKQDRILEASRESTSEGGKEYVLKGIAAQFGKENNNTIS